MTEQEYLISIKLLRLEFRVEIFTSERFYGHFYIVVNIAINIGQKWSIGRIVTAESENCVGFRFFGTFTLVTGARTASWAAGIAWTQIDRCVVVGITGSNTSIDISVITCRNTSSVSLASVLLTGQVVRVRAWI